MSLRVVLAHPVDALTCQQGGAVRYIISLVNYLSSQGIDVTLLGVLDKGLIKRNLKPTFRFVSINGHASWKWYIYLFGLIFKLPFLRLHRNAIIHTARLEFMVPFIIYYPKNPKVVALGGRQLLVFSSRHPILFKTLGSLLFLGIKIVLQRVDCVITDPRTLEYYKRIYPQIEKKAVALSTSFVDMGTFKPMNKQSVREEYGFGLDEKIVVYIGRIEKVKNLNFLIRSFVSINRRYSKVRLLLVGRGNDRDYAEDLKKMIERNGLTNVIFMGEKGQEEIPKILNCADVLALCSLSEGSPTVVREALACGLPVVSTDVGDVRQLITKDSVGSIVELDEEKFAEAIIKFFETETEKAKTERREILQQKGLDVNGVATKTLEIYWRLYQASSCL